MNTKVMICSLVLSSSLITPSYAETQSNTKAERFAKTKHIEFRIEGIQLAKTGTNHGKLYIQLFSSKEDYQQGKATAATIVTPSSETAIVNFENLTEGEYALRFFHDQNDNGSLETNLFGMPTEGYGYSNNARPNFGPVSYDEAKFSLKATDKSVVQKTEVIY